MRLFIVILLCLELISCKNKIKIEGLDQTKKLNIPQDIAGYPTDHLFFSNFSNEIISEKTGNVNYNLQNIQDPASFLWQPETIYVPGKETFSWKDGTYNHSQISVDVTGNIVEPILGSGEKFIWVVDSNTAKAYKMNTQTLEFSEGHVTTPLGNPSRTTIDINGWAWIANRDADKVNCFTPEGAPCPIGAWFATNNGLPGAGSRLVSATSVDDYIYVFVGNRATTTDGNNFTRIVYKKSTRALDATKPQLFKTLYNPANVSSPILFYGGIFDSSKNVVWASSYDTSQLFKISHVLDVNASTWAVDYSIKLKTDLTAGGAYGIGLIPAGVSGGAFARPIIAGANQPYIYELVADNTIHVYNLSDLGNYFRGIASDNNGNIWVTEYYTAKVIKLSRNSGCYTERAITCDALHSCILANYNTPTVTPASCYSYFTSPGGAGDPFLGISADKDNKVYAVGYNSRKVYVFDANLANWSTNYRVSATFDSAGTAYMYSDFSGFSTGFLNTAEITQKKCYNYELNNVLLNISKTDVTPARITMQYQFTTDPATLPGTYMTLPGGTTPTISAGLGNKCLFLKIIFSNVSEGENSKIQKVELTPNFKPIYSEIQKKCFVADSSANVLQSIASVIDETDPSSKIDIEYALSDSSVATGGAYSPLTNLTFAWNSSNRCIYLKAKYNNVVIGSASVLNSVLLTPKQYWHPQATSQLRFEDDNTDKSNFVLALSKSGEQSAKIGVNYLCTNDVNELSEPNLLYTNNTQVCQNFKYIKVKPSFANNLLSGDATRIDSIGVTTRLFLSRGDTNESFCYAEPLVFGLASLEKSGPQQDKISIDYSCSDVEEVPAIGASVLPMGSTQICQNKKCVNFKLVFSEPLVTGDATKASINLSPRFIINKTINFEVACFTSKVTGVLPIIDISGSQKDKITASYFCSNSDTEVLEYQPLPAGEGVCEGFKCIGLQLKINNMISGDNTKINDVVLQYKYSDN